MTDGMDGELLIVFVKAPRPGLVKTRLAESIGPVSAAKAYRQLVETLLAHLSIIPALELHYSPPDALTEIQPWLRPGWAAHPQSNGDLGSRLVSAFANAFASGHDRIVIIGSDCPSITQNDITAAWDALRSVDVILGPATDGGYWLVGLRQPVPVLFEQIRWSTATVLTDTIARARQFNHTVHLLQERSDVDTIQDWQAFLKQESHRTQGH